MNDSWNFRTRFMIQSSIVAAIFTVISMSVMIWYAQNKVVVLNNATGQNEQSHVETYRSWVIPITDDIKHIDRPVESEDDDNIVYQESVEEGLIFLLPAVSSKESVSISEQYCTNQVIIQFNHNKGDYFEENLPYGNYEHITHAEGEYDGKIARISLTLDEPCICKTSYYNRELLLEFLPIKSLQGPVILIDPGHGGTFSGSMVGDQTEKDILLRIAQRVRELSLAKEYHVILTRTADIELSDDQRREIADYVGAQYYIGLHLSVDIEDSRVFGMYSVCNTDYYINDYGNVDIAENLLYHTALSAKGKALRIDTASEDDAILRTMRVPSTILYLGYLSNRHEAELLVNEEYIDLLASGIVNGLDELPKE